MSVTGLIKRFDTRERLFRKQGEPKRILELGCGLCNNVQMLHRFYPKARCFGVDCDPTIQAPEFVQFKRMDLDLAKLSFENDYFDLIVFTHVIEHLKNPFSFGSEIHRVLVPGGRCYIEAPNWTSLLVPSFGFKREQGHIFNFFDDCTHIKPWSRHGLYSYLRYHCHMNAVCVGTVRNWVRVPLEPLIFLTGLITNHRAYTASSVWNLTGWSIWGIGTKSISSSDNKDEAHD